MYGYHTQKSYSSPSEATAISPPFKPNALNLPTSPCWCFIKKHGENMPILCLFNPLSRTFMLNTPVGDDAGLRLEIPFWDVAKVCVVDSDCSGEKYKSILIRGFDIDNLF